MTPTEVDDLFDDAPPSPRIIRIYALLGTGLVLTMAGLWVSVLPGAVIVLLGWWLAASENERLQSGYLHATYGRPVRRAYRAAIAGVGVVIALAIVQRWLLPTGFYVETWLSWIRAWVNR